MTGDPRYDNAKALFEQCRKSVGAMRVLKAQVDSMRSDYGTVNGVRYDREGGKSAQEHGDDKSFAAVEKMDALRSKVDDESKRYADLLYAAECAISDMERDCANTMGDVETLRLYYLMAKSSRETAKELRYSNYYINDKIELALIHVAPYVPTKW